MSPDRPAAVVVLAAGEGTRMKSSIPKVLHAVGGRTLVHHAVSRRRSSRARPPGGRRRPRPGRGHRPPGRGGPQGHHRGPGPAARHRPRRGLRPGRAAAADRHRGRHLRRRPAAHRRHPAPAPRRPRRAAERRHVLTAVADPTGYGRIVRGADGSVERIVEQKDATADELAIREFNSGVYAFDAAVLRDALSRLDTDNAQGELYLTDVLTHARSAGGRVGALVVEDVWQVEGVNDRVQLAALHRELNRRTVEGWMRAGTTVVDPAHHLDRRRRHPRARHPARAERPAARQHARRCRCRRRTQLPPRRHPGRRRRDRLEHHVRRRRSSVPRRPSGPTATSGPAPGSAAAPRPAASSR